MSATTTDQLGKIRERLANARASRGRAQKAIEAAKQVKDEQAEFVAQKQLDRAVGEIESTQQLESIMLSQMNGGNGGYSGSFLDDPTTVSMLERYSSSSIQLPPLESGGLPLGPYQSVDDHVRMLDSGNWGMPKLAASQVPDTVVGRRGPFDELGIVPQARRRIRLLDLIPTSPAVGNTVPYVIEGGGFDTAAETAEATVKPVGDITLTDGEVPVRTIAHYLKAPRQVLADVPGLQAVIQERLVYGVLRRVESAIVNGSGTGQNILGVLATSGVANVAFAAGTALGDLSLQGLVAVLNSEFEPDACVMNATTLQGLLTPKAATSGVYLNIDSPFGTGPQNLSLWGIPVVVSTLMPANVVLFGQWSYGCHLWVREAPNVLVGYDSDDLTRNKVTLLAEGRYALTVNQPTCFAIVHLA